MTKRCGNIYETMFTLDRLYAAYKTARSGKRSKASIIEFESNLGANLASLQEELALGTYAPRPYKVFEVFEPKRRVIHAPHFRDVVVQHAMYAVLYPIFDSKFIYDSWGCRKGKCTHGAADRAQLFMRKSCPSSYTLQLDIRKFFYSIDREILLQLWSEKVKDSKVLELVEAFSNYPDGKGIPIGNLLSQLSALIYLNKLDHFVKRCLKVKYYVRYVDDFILLNLSREQAHSFKNTLENWLAANLRLELSKWTIQPVRKGVNFVGYRTWRRTRFIRRHSLYKFTKSLKRGSVNSIVSLLGHAKHTGSFSRLARKCSESEGTVASLPKAVRLSVNNSCKRTTYATI